MTGAFPKTVCVVGPTASGKSALAVRIAKAFGGEMISCDSMQLYRGMDIGTAKSLPEELDGVPLHLTDILDVGETFSVSDYVELAEKTALAVAGRGKLPVFCGGTGLYVDAFAKGFRFASYEKDPAVRERLYAEYRAHGGEALYARLAAVDPAGAAGIDRANVKRVIRALEVYESTGKPFSAVSRETRENAVDRGVLTLFLTFRERETLYARIDRRVDAMMAAGLLEETRRLLASGLREAPTAGQAIGYKEFYPYFDGTATLSDCVEALKRSSRRYAKRQITWFGRNPDAVRIEMDGEDPEGAALDAVRVYLQS